MGPLPISAPEGPSDAPGSDEGPDATELHSVQEGGPAPPVFNGSVASFTVVDAPMASWATVASVNLNQPEATLAVVEVSYEEGASPSS